MKQNIDEMNILLTGGAGFIGSHIAEELKNYDCRVFIIDNFSTGKQSNIKDLDSSQFTVYNSDITNIETVESVIANHHITHIIHQAASVSVPESLSMPVKYLNNNVNNTLQLLELAVKYKIKRIIMASSCAVYGKSDENIKESTVDVHTIQTNPYALSKFMDELLFKYYYANYGLETICLRYGNVYGERQSIKDGEGAAIPAFISKYINGESPLIYGDGTQGRDFIYVKDVALANIHALVYGLGNKVYNIATGKLTMIYDLALKIAKHFPNALLPTTSNPRKGDLHTVTLNCWLANSDLNWSYSIELDEGLRRTAQWFQNNL